MRVFQIKAKSRSPKDKTNNKINISTNNFKKSSNKISQKGRNKNEPKDKKFLKKVLPHKNQFHFLSNDCSLINTTNFNNSKTNNFIFFESAMNYKENDIFKQIKSLIKHNTSNSCSNIKFINANNIKRKRTKKNINIQNNFKKEVEDNKINFSEVFSPNKTHKLYISTNYSLLLNKKKEKLERRKLYNTKLNNFRPLTLNFSNDINNFNTFRKLEINKSVKNFDMNRLNYQRNNKETKMKSKETRKIKSNSKNKVKKTRQILMNKSNLLKNSKSYGNILFSYIKSFSKSTSFSPKNIRDGKNSIKKYCSGINRIEKGKTCSNKDSSNKINLLYFRNKKRENMLISKKLSPCASRIIDMKLFTKKFIKREREKLLETRNNNTFTKDNRRNNKYKATKIFTPEENHFLAVINIQKIKINGNIIS